MERRDKGSKCNERSQKTREWTIVSLTEYICTLESFPLFLVNLKTLNMLM